MIQKHKLHLHPVILCGGSGTRLWPLSRAGFPKQFLCIDSDESLFQQAATRLSKLRTAEYKVEAHVVVCNDEHRFLAQEQLREAGINNYQLLLEPAGRNTAPALTLAALAATEDNIDPVLIVTPADQRIADQASFEEAMLLAIDEAAAGSIVILGVRPYKPETGYGYIKTAKRCDDKADLQAFDVAQFVEKPDAVTAQRYIDEGDHYWNAGMFVLKASAWLKAVEAFCPDIAATTRLSWASRTKDGSFVRPSKTAFEAVRHESIDYGVMEKCPGVFPIKMVELNANWNDLGAWEAVWQALPKDEADNATYGDVITFNSKNTLAYSTSRLVGLVGLKDIVVVETPDAVLVADKSCSQDVKYITESLGLDNREERVLHRKVLRPWGWYDSIDEGERFKVKRIRVNPKSSLSLQMHHHRAEHWIVVSGTAEITNGDSVILLTENQSTYIPLGVPHRLSNPGTIPLEIIEVQSGAYLGEDDIVRFEDTYGRT